jgi:hypothetical protein
MMKKNLVSLVASLSFASAAFVPSIAHAADEHAYGPYECREQSSSNAGLDISEYRLSKISGTGTATVLCPIDHDVAGGEGIASAKIRLLDTLDGADPTLTLVARFANSTDTFVYETRHGVSESSLTQTVYFDGGSTGVDAYYYFKIVLPTNTGPSNLVKIFSYAVEEA